MAFRAMPGAKPNTRTPFRWSGKASGQGSESGLGTSTHRIMAKPACSPFASQYFPSSEQ